jgi:hypothetical protein
MDSHDIYSKKWIWGLSLVLVLVILGACNMPAFKLAFFEQATPTPTMTYTSSATPTTIASNTPTLTGTPTFTSTATITDTSLPRATPLPTDTPAPTDTPPPTDTPAPTDTPTLAATPTLEGAVVRAESNVNCRWGPNTVYLVAGLFREGASAPVEGRDYAGNWLWIQMEGFSYHCWVAASAVLVDGNLDSISKLPGDPPINSALPSASGVGTIRDGNKVIIAWNPAPAAVDLHYLIRVNICNGQYVIEWIDVTTNTSYTVQDQQGCSGTSSGRLYVVNKTGYSSPVNIPWP